MRALGWRVADESMGVMGNVYQTWEHPDGRTTKIAFRDDGVWRDDNLPDYGASWASCEEIDAECKKRGWRWEARALRNQVYAVMVDLTGAKGFRGMTAPTFPEALAEAFCQAVENV